MDKKLFKKTLNLAKTALYFGILTFLLSIVLGLLSFFKEFFQESKIILIAVVLLGSLLVFIYLTILFFNYLKVMKNKFRKI